MAATTLTRIFGELKEPAPLLPPPSALAEDPVADASEDGVEAGLETGLAAEEPLPDP